MAFREIFAEQQGINNVFESFYTTLYTSDSKGDPSLLNNFLNKLQMPMIETSHKTNLD